MQTGLGSRSSNCHNRFNLTAVGQSHSANLRSTSSRAWLPASGRELINAVSKIRLRSVLSGNEPRGGTRWRGSAGLVERRQGSSDKACLNVLRAVDARWGGVGPSTGKSNKTATDLRTGTGTGWDNEAVGVLGQAGRGDKQVGDPGRDDKGAGDQG